MDCPHCNVENLVGARTCASCGRPMLTGMQSVPRAGAASPAGPTLPGLGQHAPAPTGAFRTTAGTPNAPHHPAAPAAPIGPVVGTGRKRPSETGAFATPLSAPSAEPITGEQAGLGTRPPWKTGIESRTPSQPGIAARAASQTGDARRPTSATGSVTGAPPRSLSVRSTAQEMASATLWGAGPSPAPSMSRSVAAAAVKALCSVCLESFDRPANEPGQGLCPACRGIPSDADRMAPNDVQMHPALGVTAERGFAAPQGERERKPAEFRRRGGIGGFPAFLAALAVLGAGGWAVHWMMNRPKDVAAEVIGDYQAQACTIALEPGEHYEAEVHTTIEMDMSREEPRAFGGTASKVLEVRQTSLQESSIVVVQQESGSFVMDVRSAGRVTDQHGRIQGEDARETALYPWEGPQLQMRVRASASRPLVQLDGESVEAGSTVPPVAALGALGAPDTELKPGQHWGVDLALPALVDRGGRLFSWSFPADVAYMGTAVRNGIHCAAFRVNAILPKRLPQRVDDAFNRQTGKIAGAVWIELKTGLVVQAELHVDARLWKDVARVDDDLRVKGRILVERK